jgi:hypothetical protein
MIVAGCECSAMSFSGVNTPAKMLSLKTQIVDRISIIGSSRNMQTSDTKAKQLT